MLRSRSLWAKVFEKKKKVGEQINRIWGGGGFFGFSVFCLWILGFSVFFVFFAGELGSCVRFSWHNLRQDLATSGTSSYRVLLFGGCLRWFEEV